MLHIIHKSHAGKFLHWEVASIHRVYLGSGGHTILVYWGHGVALEDCRLKVSDLSFFAKLDEWTLPWNHDFLVVKISRKMFYIRPHGVHEVRAMQKQKEKPQRSCYCAWHSSMHLCSSTSRTRYVLPDSLKLLQPTCASQTNQGSHSKSAWSKLQQFLRHRKV